MNPPQHIQKRCILNFISQLAHPCLRIRQQYCTIVCKSFLLGILYNCLFVCLFVCFITTFVGYLMPNPFLYTCLGSLTRLQRSNMCILQLQPTEPLGHLLGESYPFTEKQYVYSTAPADWATRTLAWGV